MYKPNDAVIKNFIKNGVRQLIDAEDESCDKLQTIEDICRELETALPITASPRY